MFKEVSAIKVRELLTVSPIFCLLFGISIAVFVVETFPNLYISTVQFCVEGKRAYRHIQLRVKMFQWKIFYRCNLMKRIYPGNGGSQKK